MAFTALDLGTNTGAKPWTAGMTCNATNVGVSAVGTLTAKAYTSSGATARPQWLGSTYAAYLESGDGFTGQLIKPHVETDIDNGTPDGILENLGGIYEQRYTIQFGKSSTFVQNTTPADATGSNNLGFIGWGTGEFGVRCFIRNATDRAGVCFAGIGTGAVLRCNDSPSNAAICPPTIGLDQWFTLTFRLYNETAANGGGSFMYINDVPVACIPKDRFGFGDGFVWGNELTFPYNGAGQEWVCPAGIVMRIARIETTSIGFDKTVQFAAATPTTHEWHKYWNMRHGVAAAAAGAFSGASCILSNTTNLVYDEPTSGGAGTNYLPIGSVKTTSHSGETVTSVEKIWVPTSAKDIYPYGSDGWMHVVFQHLRADTADLARIQIFANDGTTSYVDVTATGGGAWVDAVSGATTGAGTCVTAHQYHAVVSIHRGGAKVLTIRDLTPTTFSATTVKSISLGSIASFTESTPVGIWKVTLTETNGTIARLGPVARCSTLTWLLVDSYESGTLTWSVGVAGLDHIAFPLGPNADGTGTSFAVGDIQGLPGGYSPGAYLGCRGMFALPMGIQGNSIEDFNTNCTAGLAAIRGCRFLGFDLTKNSMSGVTSGNLAAKVATTVAAAQAVYAAVLAGGNRAEFAEAVPVKTGGAPGGWNDSQRQFATDFNRDFSTWLLARSGTTLYKTVTGSGITADNYWVNSAVDDTHLGSTATFSATVLGDPGYVKNMGVTANQVAGRNSGGGSTSVHITARARAYIQRLRRAAEAGAPIQ